MTKTALSLFAALLLFFSTALSAQADTPSFDDVEEGDLGYEEIIELARDNIIRGLPSGDFGVQEDVSRADTAILFTRALDLPARTGANPFPDVAGDAYYVDDVVRSAENGIFTGDDNGSFHPSSSLTREQMASVLVRAMELEAASDASGDFDDIDDANHTHEDDIRTLAAAGITEGRPGNQFAPKDNVTRTEFAIFLFRALQAEAEAPEDETPPEEEAPPEEDEPTEPAPEPEPAPEVNASTITTSDGSTLSGTISNQNVSFDLSGKSDSTTFTAGTITVDQDSLLELSGFPPIGGIPEEQNLSAGENNLLIADVLADEDIQLGTIRTFAGNNLELTGTLTNADGSVQEVSVTFHL
ncbi:S-layer homology domain-containing protein [Alkalicoccus chagannorensis]|uniref:S-layer homology domain-containing protein n=1 Tax=Alkalicoccus chagannorensis TaxID=427072 RepID=UPI000417F61A|nr:S-layer homology domain-containing protein [Alkalicoccus chagannorensis]